MTVKDEEIKDAVAVLTLIISSMSFQRLMSLFLEANEVRSIPGSSLSCWPLRVERRGLEYKFFTAIGKECEDDRGWWVQVADPVEVTIIMDKEKLDEAKQRIGGNDVGTKGK